VENHHHHRSLAPLFRKLKGTHDKTEFKLLKEDLLNRIDIAIAFYPIIRKEIAKYVPSKYNPKKQRWEQVHKP
jgi:hypothetical protein